MTYTGQEKIATIAQYQQGISAQKLSVEYGVCERTIYRWAKKYGDISLEEKRTLTTQECDMLLRRVTKLENIVAILKTVNCTVHAH